MFINYSCRERERRGPASSSSRPFCLSTRSPEGGLRHSDYKIRRLSDMLLGGDI